MNFKTRHYVYRRTLTLTDIKKRSNPSSSVRSNSLFMRQLFHGMPTKRRREIFLLFGACVFFMALVKSLPEIFSEQFDMRGGKDLNCKNPCNMKTAQENIVLKTTRRVFW